MKKKYLLSLLIFLFNFSCSKVVKEQDEKFDRQTSDLSTDEILIGDNINFWETDTPQAAIFILNDKASFLKGFAIKALKFREKDKTQEELDKLISTENLYQLEVYELPKPAKIDRKTPEICDYISNNGNQAVLVGKVSNISFRIKEREWVWTNTKVNPERLVFVRLGIGNPFSVIQNKAIDGLWVNAKRSLKPWEEYLPNEKKQIISWGCQEAAFLENRVIEPTFYNPDVVFNYL